MTNTKTWTLPNRHTTPPRFRSISSPTTPCFTPRSHSSSPLRKTPSPIRKDVKQRSSASLSLFGSFVRSLKVKNKKGRTSPGRSGLGISLGLRMGRATRGSPLLGRMQSLPGINTNHSPRRTGQWEEMRLSPPQRERTRMIEERRRRWEARQGKGKPMASDDGEGEGDDEGGLGPAQYLFTSRSRTSLGSGVSSILNPFKTPPATPMAIDGDEEMHMDEPPLSPVGNSPDSAKSQRRRRAERSRMKSLQILGPEACGAVADGWE
ncbi:hypothetical protein Hypma_008396 [Hypsizygus marmoreus]|uniref:Uncharacterized protein n=1 Tax=Hypsizygus marmoreus TaxID=39966 RepID=A0A369JY66_HYPMA|nr:hypothetical protein Hypma_008396 [Hypsizygus marmoreus]